MSGAKIIFQKFSFNTDIYMQKIYLPTIGRYI